MHLCIYIYKDSWKRAFFDQLCKTYFVNKYEQTLKENKNGPPRSRIFCVDPHPLNTPKGNSAKPKVTLGQGITGHLSVRPNPRQLRTPPFFENTFPVLILLLFGGGGWDLKPKLAVKKGLGSPSSLKTGPYFQRLMETRLFWPALQDLFCQ